MSIDAPRTNRRIVVLCPHFDPDTAPTGVVMSRIVHELVALGDEVHVVTSLPWYRTHAIEAGWTGRLVRREVTPWGSISRVHPFPGDDKTDLPRRALGFLGYTALAGVEALRIGGPLSRVDAVIAMSPPITLGLTGWLVSRLRRGRMIFNIQDVFPDAAVETGAITNRSIVSAARALERMSYLRSDAVTVLSDDLADNVRGKLPPSAGDRVHVIPNFVDTDAIVPGDRLTPYRAELGLGEGPIVLYAGNVGFSQSLDLMLAAAREMPEATFLVNGDGAARPDARTCRARVSPTSASPAISTRPACPNCSPPATSTSSRSSAAWPASACRRRRTRSWPPPVPSSPRSIRAPPCRRSWRSPAAA